MQNKKSFYIAASSLGAFFCIMNMFQFQNAFLGVLSMILYAHPLSKILGVVFLGKYDKKNHFFGFFLLLSSQIILNTVFYYLHGVTSITIVLSLLLPLTTFFFSKEIYTKPKLNKTKIGEEKKTFYLPIGLFFFDIGLITTLFANASTELMRSPWHALSPKFFLIFAVATGLLFFIIWKNNHKKLVFFLSSMHLFITFSIVAILYPLGFGFDAFVHRATQEWIFEHGFILPKTIYYIGQYSFIVWLRHLTHIPIFYIDIFLVPLLAASTLPKLISSSLYHAWDIKKKYGLMLVWLIPFISLLIGFLNLTTPFNLAFLFAILTVFSILTFLHKKISIIFPAILALAAACSHILVGAPLLIFVLGGYIIKKLKNTNTRIVFFALLSVLALLAPMMFTIRNLMLGLGFPSFSNLLSALPNFISLFTRPYWYAETSTLVFEILYTWQLCIIPLILILAGFGFWKRRNQASAYFLFSGIAIFLSAFLLRSLIVFPDVVSYEQGDFPMRLIKLSLLFALPFAMFGLHEILQMLLRKRENFLYILFPGIFIAITISLYLGYPQYNTKARFPGLNVTQSDFNAVEWIHEQNEGYGYIVLSNQLVSAAALTKYSFAKYHLTKTGEQFYYSIPTGGPLYAEYGRMLYQGQQRQFMESAMDLAGVDKAYFVINSYWANSQNIIEG
ncbi:MAG: hypothetical protein ABII02_00805, partial [Candidatus Magasanikbacteria bacterium]